MTGLILSSYPQAIIACFYENFTSGFHNFLKKNVSQFSQKFENCETLYYILSGISIPSKLAPISRTLPVAYVINTRAFLTFSSSTITLFEL